MASRPSHLPDPSADPPEIETFKIEKLTFPNLNVVFPDGLFLHPTDGGVILSGTMVGYEMHGAGTIIWPNGDVFTGTFDQGNPHGKCNFIKKGVFVVEGSFSDGFFSGFVDYKQCDQKIDSEPDVLGSSYQGEVRNGTPHGVGRWECPLHRHKYHGFFENGYFEGVGHFWTKGKKIYEGEYRKGQKHGVGIHRNGDGVYAGTFDKSKRHGFGTLSIGKDYDYSGNWENDLKCGHGKFIVPDGGNYEGTHENGIANGIGTLTDKGGNVYVGQVTGGLKCGFGKITYCGPGKGWYEGSFFKGKKSGKGEEKCDKWHVRGSWLDDQLHGEVRITYYVMNDRSRREIAKTYHGDFLQGKRSGSGKLVVNTPKDANREQYAYEGDWVDGEKHGKGKERFATTGEFNPIHYDGVFQGNKRHGKGVSTLRNGSVYTGQHENGYIHGGGAIFTEKNLTMTGTFVQNRPLEGCLTFENGKKQDVRYAGNCETVYADIFPSAEFYSALSSPKSSAVGQKRALSPQAAGGSSSKRISTAVVPVETHVWAISNWAGEFEELSLPCQQTLGRQFQISKGDFQPFSILLEEPERTTLGLHKDNKGVANVDFTTMKIEYVYTKDQQKQTRKIRRTSVNSKVSKNWVHQQENIEVIPVTEEEVDFGKVRSAFFSQPRVNGTSALISMSKHKVVAVNRIQNSDLLGIYYTHRDNLAKRKDRNRQQIMDSEKLLWHGTGMQNPESIATGAGLDKGYSNGGFYGQGNYCAVEASYSHHDRYVHRTSDQEGKIYDCTGKYFHLLLVRVLVGKPLVCPRIFRDDERSHKQIMEKLGKDYDSVQGGPHQPLTSGPYAKNHCKGDDSVIYVTYNNNQVLPEFWVTYVAI